MRRGCVTVLLGLLAVAVAGLALARPALLERAGHFVVSTDTPRHADAIVVLSGSMPDRMLEAVDLYQAGIAPWIVLVAERPRPGLRELHRRGAHLPAVHELNVSIATQLGVPRQAIVVLDEPANSTLSEGDVIVQYLRRRRAGVAIIVTSKMHSYRAGVIYRWLAGDEIEILSVPSRHDPFDPRRWWYSRGYTRRLIFEYQKLAVFWLRDRWRPRRAPAQRSQRLQPVSSRMASSSAVLAPAS